MAGATQQTFRCRGLRIWCNRRCEATTGVEPAGYPVMGFYCSLHSYQKPRSNPDGSLLFDNTDIETFIRSRTSFMAPEGSVVLDMSRSPGMVKDRPSAPKSTSGLQVISWLMERRGLDEPAAKAYAQRMVQLNMMQPLTPGQTTFTGDKQALYRLNPPPKPEQQGGRPAGR